MRSNRSVLLAGLGVALCVLSWASIYAVNLRKERGIRLNANSQVTVSQPENLIMPPAARTESTIDLMWDKPANDKGIKQYQIYKDGTLMGTTTKGSYKAIGLLSDKHYTFTVLSVDQEGHLSQESNRLTVSTKRQGDMFDITKFGAVGDGKTLSTKAIQAAIDACTPGGTVHVPAGVFLTGAIFLKSDMTLLLDEGSRMLGVSDFGSTKEEIAVHYPLIKSRYEGFHRDDIFASIITADGGRDDRDTHPGKLKNISIIGKGTIDAQGSKLSPKQTAAINRSTRSNTITMMNCEDVYIQGITIENSPNWTIHPIYTRNLSTEGITLHTEKDPVTGKKYEVENGDGWDPDSSENVYLYNSVLLSHDDNVAVKSGADKDGLAVGRPTRNVRITDCVFPSGGGLALGSEMSGGIEHVYVRDIVFGHTDRGIQIKTRRGRGGYVRDVLMKGIRIDNGGQFGINLNMRYYDEDLKKPAGDARTTPVFERIHFENIEVGFAKTAILMSGLPESHMKQITFQHIDVTAETGLQGIQCDDITFDEVKLHIAKGPISTMKESTGIRGKVTGTSPLSAQ